MSTPTLTSVLALLEKAEAGSRELDAAIAVVIFKAASGIDLHAEPAESDCEAGTYWMVGPSWRSLTTSQPYTSSLDAALSLVPEGWAYRIQRNLSGFCFCELQGAEMFQLAHTGDYPTAPLALCIASIKARLVLAGRGE